MRLLRYQIAMAATIALLLFFGPIQGLAGQSAVTQPQVPANRTIGGKVFDENHSPIAGAKVVFFWTEPAGPGDLAIGFEREHEFTAITNAQGAWAYDGVPTSALAHLKIILQSSDFAPLLVKAIDVGALEKQSALWTMSRGVDVAGHVVDPDGKPVPNARLYGGPPLPISLRVNPVAITDLAGRFVLRHMPNRPKAVIWTAAEGFAPLADVYDLTTQRDTISIALSYGRTMHGRVVDASENPVAGAKVVLMSDVIGDDPFWSVMTDNDGRFEMHHVSDLRSAVFDVVKKDYCTSGGECRSIDDNIVVSLLRTGIRVTGTVVDSRTGNPIPKFQVFAGVQFPPILELPPKFMPPISCADGRFEVSFDQNIADARSWCVAIKAPGYFPKVSPPILMSGTQDFSLEPGIEGRLLSPDGKPLAGTEVATIGPGQWATIRLDTLYGPHVEPTYSNADGEFVLKPCAGHFRVVACNKDGFVQADRDQMSRSTDLQISRWATIEGLLLVDGKPAPNQTVDLESHDPNVPMNQSEPRMMVSQWVQTDAAGRFKFDHVLPTKMWIGRPIFTPEPDGKSLTVSGLTESQSVTLTSGQTLFVNLGK